MRVPTRENRHFLPPARRAHALERDDRVPVLATSGARRTVHLLLAKAYRDIEAEEERLSQAEERSRWLPEPGFGLATRRFAALMQESRWERILRKHRLSRDE